MRRCAPSTQHLRVPLLPALSGPREAFPMLATTATFTGALNRTCATRGVARIEPPFGGPLQLLKYLGAYVNRVAISPARIRGCEETPSVGYGQARWRLLRQTPLAIPPVSLSCVFLASIQRSRPSPRSGVSSHPLTAYDPATGLVTHTWATNAQPDITRAATIPATEFLGRFAQHILPPGFQRIRFRGLWCTAHRATKLHVAQQWFATQRQLPPLPPATEPPERPLEDDPCRCTTCGLGRWRLVPGTWQRPTTAERRRMSEQTRRNRRTQTPSMTP